MEGFVTSAQRYDVLSVGDVATDVFIRLPDDVVHERKDEQGRWLEIPLGSKISYTRGTMVAAGGSASNAAFAMARLGLRVGISSFLAHDHTGLDLLEALHIEHIDTNLIHVDAQAHTNRSFVLSYRGERTILVHHAAFDYHWPHLRPSEVPAWLYLTSLGPTALEYQDQIADWLDANPNVRLIFQPGTFQIQEGAERLARLYRRAEVVLASTTEAAHLLGMAATTPLEQLAKPLLDLGPAIVVVCDGMGGGIASNGDNTWMIDPFPDTSAPLDRTGAEDTFSATAAAAIVRDMPLEDALRWASVNFMSVSHELGAQAGQLSNGEIARRLEELDPPFLARRV